MDYFVFWNKGELNTALIGFTFFHISITTTLGRVGGEADDTETLQRCTLHVLGALCTSSPSGVRH